MAQEDYSWKSTPLAEHPATLPCSNIPDSVDHGKIARDALQTLYDLEIGSLADNAIWRDSLAFTGTFRTFFGPQKILRTWKELSNGLMPNDFQIDECSPFVMRLGPETSWIQATFSFNTRGSMPCRCSGTIGLSPESSSKDSAWKIWLLCTVLEQPDGYPDVDSIKPTARSTCHGPVATDHYLNPQESCTNTSHNPESPVLDCLVIGAGIGGLCMAARLKALNLSYKVIEKHDDIGDVWTKDRYDSIRLHTSKHYNQMPGHPVTFGKDEPYLLTGQQLSNGFRSFTQMFGIDVLTSTCLDKAEFDAHERVWTARVRRNGHVLPLRTRHIVLAIGDMGHKPKLPEYKNRHLYKGAVMHARAWKNASPWRGKRGVVVGSANSAHDIISDMAKNDFKSITMIQRSETFVLPVSTFSALVDPVYNEQTPIEASDRTLLSLPLSIQRLEAMAGIRAMADLNPKKFDMMEANGFKTRRYGDLWGQIYDSQGKHFFDIGAGDLIADGRVKVRSDALPVAYTESGLLLNDGSSIDADVIVFATGYISNFRSSVEDIFSPEVSRNLRPFWGSDAEGEVLGAWRQTGREYSHHVCIESILY